MKIVSATNFYASTAANTTAAALTTLGEHATDDDIFICVGHDGAGTGAITMTTGTGWTEVVTQAASDDVRSTVFRKRVTAPETVPVFSANGATSEEWTGTVFVVRGLNATTPVSHWHRVDVSNTNSWNSNGGVAGSTLAASSIAGPTAATYTDGQVLVLHAHADSAQPLSPDIGVLTEIGKSRSAASVAHIVGFKTLNGSGTVPNVVIRGNASGATEGGVCYALVLNPATSSDTLGCATADVSVVAYLGDIGAIHDQAITWSAANSRDATNGGTILGVATGSTAITPITSTGPENTSSPWGAFTTWTTAANLGTAAWTGGIGTLTSVVDISGKMLTFQMGTSYVANATPTGAEGLGIYLEDNASNWSFFQLRKSNTMSYSSELFTPMFDVSTALRSAGSGTLDLTNIKYIGFMAHRLAGSASSRSFLVKSILAVGKTTFFGGGTTDPTTWDAAVRCLTSWSMIGPAVRHVASTDQFQIKQSSDIGDGTNAVVFSSSATSMAFPSAWDGTVGSLSDYKATVGPGGKNITLVGGTGSALVLDGSLISADPDTAVEFTVSASYAGTVSASGCTLSGYTFTDNKGLSWNGLTIQNGGTATLAAGADLTNCTVQKTTSTNAALTITANGTTIATSTISCVMNTGASSAYHIALGASVTAITLNGVTLTGTPASGFKFYSALTSGELTITTDGTGTAIDSGDVEFAAGTAFATVVAPTVTADISITGMSNTVGANNRLQIINQTAAASANRANSTAYSAGDVRLRQTGAGSENTAGLYLRCTTSGTSAGSPPTWNTTVGGTTTDGTVVWTTYAILYYDADPAATSLTDTYIDGEEFKAGETVEIRFAEEDPAVSFKTYSTSVIAATTGFSALVLEDDDSSYATYATSGITQDSIFSPNFAANYIVLDTDTNFTGSGAYAYYCYLLTTSEGMYRFWGGLTGIDPGNIRNNVNVVSLYFDCSSGFVRQTDDIRIFRSDGLRPALDPVSAAGGGIEINWKVPVNVVSTGGSALTPTESAQLMALPSASTTASAVGARTVDGSYSEDEILRLIAAALAGSRAGIGTATETYTGLDGVTPRIVFNPDANGNGTPVLDAT